MPSVFDQVRVMGKFEQKPKPLSSGRVVGVNNDEKGLYRTYRVRRPSGLTVSVRGVLGIAISSQVMYDTIAGQRIIVDSRTPSPENTTRILV